MPEAQARPLVLVVDDMKEIRELFASVLEKAGFRVDTAGDGQRAIVKAVELHPDVILMDLVMPGMSGFQAAEQIQQRPDMKSIPVIICTGYSTEAQVRDAGYPFLRKPCSMSALRAAVQGQLRQGKKE